MGLCARCLLGLAISASQEVSSEAPTLPEVPISSEAPTVGISSADFSAGEVRADRYQIRSLLGRGGMGEVWRAYDLKLRVDVALKALLPELVEDEQALASLRQEVRSAREVISPNVCRVFDLEEMDGRELVSMEYIDGTTLLEILQNRGPLDLGEAREIAAQFLAGLEAIHAAGLVHRDLKPENIMVTRSGRVVVMDFGIAKGLAEGSSGAIAGTPAYMAPEHARGGAVDARSDVFAAGVVLAEMIAPDGVGDLAARQSVWEGAQHDPPDLPESPWLPVLRQALAKNPDRRYAGASSLVRALEEVALRVEGAEDVHPYPGLAAFTAEDAEYFFGRELEVEEMWKKLRRPHLTALIGPSGAGKSSFLRAGLLSVMPAGWRAVVCAPSNRPFMALASALANELEGDTEAVQQLLQFDSSDIAVSVISSWRRQHEQALVVVDQFEELFTQNPSEVQARFSEFLSRLVLEADTHVLLSMRDDFLFYCSGQSALAPIFSEMTPLRPPSGAALRRAVVQPALKCGYRFEDEELVEEILSEVEDERGALPMLAFAASRLWEQRDREEGLLTRQAYEAIGGVGGALAQHAEATLERIGGERVPIVRELFRNLVTAQGTRAARDREELLSVFGADDSLGIRVGEGLAPSRDDVGASLAGAREGASPSPTPEREAAKTVLNTLIDARLLTSYEVPATEEEDASHHRIEIVHESLLTAWPRLVRWQTQDADSAQLRDQLRQAAKIWEERGRLEDLLWLGTSFKEYRLWRERYEGGLSTVEEAFGEAMTRHAERRRRWRRMAIASSFVVLLVVLGIIGGLWRRSVAEAQRAEAANLLSQAQVRLEDHPSAAIAYAVASLERSDNQEVRHLILDALWRGPAEIRLPTSSPYSLDFSPDGRWLATADPDEGVKLWPSNGGQPMALETKETYGEGRISPKGDLIAFTQSVNEIGLWSFPSGRFLRSIALGGSSTQNFWFSHDGKRLIASTELGVKESKLEVLVRSWPVEGGEPDLVARLEVSRESVGTYFGVDPTETRVAWVEGSTLNMRPLAPTSQDAASVVSLDHDRALSMAVFDDEGRQLATADAVGTIRVWSLESDPPELNRTLRGAAYVNPWSVRFDSSGSMIGTSDRHLWDLTGAPDARPLWLRRAAGAIEGEQEEGGYGVAFHPESRWLATGHSYSVSLWPLARPYPQVIPGHEQYVDDVEFTPDGKRIVSTSGDGSVRVWPLDDSSNERSRVLYQGAGQWDAPRRLTIAADGSFVAIGTYTGQVWLLPLDGGQVRELTGFSDLIMAVAVAPGARSVAAGSGMYVQEEAIVRVWDLDTGETQILDAGDGRRVQQLEFTNDGSLWTTSGSLLRRWDLAGEEPRQVEEIELSGQESATGYVRDLSSGDRQALFGGSRRGSGRLWIHDLDAGSSRELSSHGNLIARAGFDSTRGIVVTADKLGAVRVGSVQGGEPHLLLGHEGEVNDVAISPDGKWIASGADDMLIYLWPMPDLSQPPLHTLPREELLAKLRSLTNLRVVEDSDSPSGWKLEVGPFPGWEEVPTW